MKINIEMSPKEKKIGLGILIGLAAVILLVGVVLGAISISKKRQMTVKRLTMKPHRQRL